MPQFFRRLSKCFVSSKLRMSILILLVVCSLVGFGVYEAVVGKEGISRRIAAVVGLVWSLTLAVVWFDETKRRLSVGVAWQLAVALDIFVAACLVLLMAA